MFELYPGREARHAPVDLPIDQVIPPPSDKNEHWHTTSGELIDALGLIGQDYATPKEFAHKIDLSHTDAFSAAQDDRQARHKAAANAALAKEASTWRNDLKGALARYLRDVAPLVDFTVVTNSQLSASPLLDAALLNFLNDWPLKYLRSHGLNVSDLMNWAWILTARTSDQAIIRFVLIRDLVQKGDLSAKSLPNFVFTFLLRRRNITARGLRFLLLHAWSLINPTSALLEQNGKFAEQPSETHLPVDTYRKIIPHVQENGSSFQEDVFIVNIVRLLRHARRVWPAACESITALCCECLNGSNFTKADAGGQNSARLSFIYNTVLSLLAAPASIQPFISAIHQQRAQFAVLRRMSQFDPPLVVDRRGYRAVTSVQLMHKKTMREREWAHLKSKSWPPWKEDRLGIDADIGPEQGISRAKEALITGERAGYTAHGWDRAASLLSGWDTDGSPSIQTRTRFPSSTSSDSPEDEQAQVWANRIRATRTLNEAWGAFQNYKDSKLRSYHKVYGTIFEKLVLDARRKAAEGAQQKPAQSVSKEEGQEVLPGDGVEVFPPPRSPRDLVYCRTLPPSVDEFIDLIVHEDLKPRGRFLAALLTNASSISSGIRILVASGLPFPYVSALLKESNQAKQHVGLQASLQGIPPYIFDSFIILLARCGPSDRYKDDGSDSSGLSAEIPLAPALFCSPLSHASDLMRLAEPRNRRPWLHLLGALARDHLVVDYRVPGASKKWRHDILSWRAMLRLISRMEELDVGLDLEAFMKLCTGLEKAIMAGEKIADRAKGTANVEAGARDMVEDVLTQGLPFVKGIFKTLVRTDSMLQGPHEYPAEVQVTLDEDVNQEASRTDVDPTITSSAATETHPEFADTPNNGKNFLPAACLLPRLLEVPRPAHLHQFIRVLGLSCDYDGLLDLIEWIALHADDIEAQVDEQRNGSRMFRRCMIATRVFLERSWTYYDIPDRAKHVWVERDVEPAPQEIWQVIRNVIEVNKAWGGWPTDEEVEVYVMNGRFV